MVEQYNNTVEMGIGSRNWGCKTVNAALTKAAEIFGCEKSELICEAAEPVYFGRMVWVYRGEFDADTAASLFVPTKLFLKWRRHKGICQLR